MMNTVSENPWRALSPFLILAGVCGFVIGVTVYTAYSFVRANGEISGEIIRAICANEDPAYVGAFWPLDAPGEARCMTAEDAEQFADAPL